MYVQFEFQTLNFPFKKPPNCVHSSTLKALKCFLLIQDVFIQVFQVRKHIKFLTDSPSPSLKSPPHPQHPFGHIYVHFKSHAQVQGLTLTVLVMTIDAQWEGMGDVGSVRYELALLPPCPTIRVLNYSN